jgi:hypothetical protein
VHAKIGDFGAVDLPWLGDGDVARGDGLGEQAADYYGRHVAAADDGEFAAL